jgi:hypothetical protein
MKNYHKFIIILLVISFLVPQAVFASWWNPFSWNIWRSVRSVFIASQVQEEPKQDQEQEVFEEELKTEETNLEIEDKPSKELLPEQSQADIEKRINEAERLRKQAEEQKKQDEIKKQMEEAERLKKQEEEKNKLSQLEFEQKVEDYLLKREEEEKMEKQIEEIKTELAMRKGLEYSIRDISFNVVYLKSVGFFINHTEIIDETESDLEVFQRIFNLVLQTEKSWEEKSKEMEADCRKKGDGWAWINNDECVKKITPNCQYGPAMWNYPNWGECPPPSCFGCAQG